MKTQTWGYIIAAMIGGLAVFLGMYVSMRKVETVALTTSTTTPIQIRTPTTTATPTSGAATKSVVVAIPQSGAHVGHSFNVSGTVPAGWAFEAQFPLMVRDANDNVVGRATGSTGGDWTSGKPLTFAATMQIDATYHGPATLIILKDNPSGLPENDDSFEVPIVVD